ELLAQSNEDRLALASLCQFRRLYRASAQFYAAALAADTSPANDLRASQQYHAACVAAQAGCGLGEDARTLDDRGKLRLRALALAWPQGDLARGSSQLAARPTADRAEVLTRMKGWLNDPALTGVREPAALARLRGAERQAWQKLWREVESLL